MLPFKRAPMLEGAAGTVAAVTICPTVMPAIWVARPADAKAPIPVAAKAMTPATNATLARVLAISDPPRGGDFERLQHNHAGLAFVPAKAFNPTCRRRLSPRLHTALQYPLYRR